MLQDGDRSLAVRRWQLGQRFGNCDPSLLMWSGVGDLLNWLQVSASAKLSKVDEREGQEFEAKMTNLLGLKAQQQSFEFILPRKGPLDSEAEFVQDFVKEAFAPTLRLLPVAWILFDIRFHSGIEDTLAIGFAVKAGVQVKHGAFEVEANLLGDPLEVFQASGQ